MKFSRRLILLLLLLAWLPASSHCLIAAALQNAVISDCCVDSKRTQTTDSHNNSDCCPFCDTFESGKFLTSSKDKSDTLAGVDIHFSISSLLRVAKCSKALSFIPHESPPSSLSWKFESRLVRLGRSPSILF